MRRNEKQEKNQSEERESIFLRKNGELVLTPHIDYIFTLTPFSGS